MAKPVQVKTTKHDDKRVNIPTQEMSDFMTDEQKQPRPLLYPRNPALDPQLVWQGKDKQDIDGLEVLSKPVYVQEKIHPLAIIENVKAQAKEQAAQPQQLDMFSDFNGIKWEDQVDFYSHEQNWTNRLILGNSLEVMASLADREGLKGQVQMIYLDPPYGIKFGSNWQVSTQDRSVKDNETGLSRQPEQVKAFRDTWELGIHSYLAYLRERLEVARELLTETGSVFVQIGDENVHLVRALLDEVFGSGNFVRQIVYRTSAPLGSKYIPTIFDTVLWYGKNIDSLKFRRIFTPKTIQDDTYYNTLDLPDGVCRRLTDYEQRDEASLPDQAKVFANITLVAAGPNPNCVFPVGFNGKSYNPTGGRGWKTNEPGMLRLRLANRLYVTSTVLRYKFYLEDYPLKELTNIWTDMAGASDKVYVVQTNTDVITRCLLMTTDPGDLVLDPTMGSGTTAYVAEQWGRRWITTDTSRVALALARTRLMSARFPYFKLADPKGKDMRQGFVYKTVPHVMLKDIANNPEIDDIHAKYQPQLEALRERINTLLSQEWQEWEIPRPDELETAAQEQAETLAAKRQELEQQVQALWQQATGEQNRLLAQDTDAALTRLKALLTEAAAEAQARPDSVIPAEARAALTEWWALRRQRQTEIDASIARNSQQETLYDQPEEDSRIVRVTGPFTVESLSPYKPISPAAAEALPTSQRDAQANENAGKYEAQIIENLRTAGVQNTKAGERLEFDLLEMADGGIHIQAEGEYTDKAGIVRRVVVCIGPEHGTVGKDLIKAAATEAVRGVSADLLLVCGFSFDAEVSEEVSRYGRLTVLPVRMNPDLTMRSLLKKTDRANLFMIFGEPDMTVTKDKGKVTVKLHGLDIYDPTTGEIRSSSTKDIACWFIDTNYDGNSFFVRHAYFTGAGDPYDKLKRALRADINEDAWQSLYHTESLPFDPPATGRIAVKVINHFGDEVLKVWQVV